MSLLGYSVLGLALLMIIYVVMVKMLELDVKVLTIDASVIVALCLLYSMKRSGRVECLCGLQYIILFLFNEYGNPKKSVH